MPSLDASYPAIRAALAGRYGLLSPRVADEAPFDAILAVILGRSLDPRKVDLARDALRDAGWLGPEALAGADPAEVAGALYSAGVKLTPKAVAPLIKIARWLADLGAETLPEAPTEAVRDELLAINGIGPATADAILLDALDRPVYPVDRPSYRIFARHGWIEPTADYDEARDTFERREPDDPAALRQLADWLDRIGSDFCRASRAKCERCPLRPFLPEGGPYEPGGE